MRWIAALVALSSTVALAAPVAGPDPCYYYQQFVRCYPKSGLNIPAITWLDTTKGIVGTTTNDSAAAGYVGQFESHNPSGTVAVGLTGAYKTITSLVDLGAGDWDVEGVAVLAQGTINTPTRIFGVISRTDNDADSLTSGGIIGVPPLSGTGNIFLPTGRRRISLAAPTTIYLVGRADYTSAGTAAWDVQSFISARRAR